MLNKIFKKMLLFIIISQMETKKVDMKKYALTLTHVDYFDVIL